MKILMLGEVMAFDHKGVVIYINLDYERGLVSFVEKDGKPKKWLFTDRTEAYLGGWYLILEAMQEATKYSDTRLKEQAKAREEVKEKEMVDLMIG